MKILIIIPAFNEEKNILSTVSSIKEHTKHDYIVINDGSTDKTEQLLTEHSLPHITLLKNLGIGGAMQTGYKYAMQNGYDIAIQIDADGQHKPCYIDELVGTLTREDADMVIGSRFIEKKGFQSTVSRRIGKGILTGIIRLLTGTVITDPTSGFRVCSRDVIEAFASSYPTDYPEPETVLELLTTKRRVVEVPMIMNSRADGKTSITPIKSIYYMVKVSIALVFTFINNKLRRKK